MTFDSISERAAALDAELAELAAREELSDEDETRFEEIEAELDVLASERAKLEKRAAAEQRARKLAEKPENVGSGEESKVRTSVRTDDPYDLSEVRMYGPSMKSELRGRALKAVETTDRWEMDDNARQRVVNLIERKDDARGTIARLVLATGTEAYKRAWAKAITGNMHLLTADDQRALERAASLTNAAGGFAVPFPIDPTLVVTGDGSSNPFRMISRVETITTDSWQGVSAGAISASWDGEAAEVSDDTPTWAQPSVPVHKAQAFVPYSIEIGQDYPNLAADLAVLFAQGKDDLEATAFATGTGSSQPTGIVTAIDGTGNDTGTATTDTYALADVYTVQETLGAKYRGRASWVMNQAILNDTRQFATANNYHGFTVDLTAAGIPALLGRPVYESSAMDGTINAAAENNIIVFGDFSNYLIADRVGAVIENIPHLFATANNLPSGQRGAYMSWRVGADSINDDAFVLLNAT